MCPIAPPSTARPDLQNALASLENRRRIKAEQQAQIKTALDYLRDLLLLTASRPGASSINLGLLAATERWLEALESGEQVDHRSAARFTATVKKFVAADPRIRPDAFPSTLTACPRVLRGCRRPAPSDTA